jgi:23S rRNA (adenine2503-C2)-methyltransferase
MILPLSDYDLPALSQTLERLGHKPGHALALLRRFYESGGNFTPDGLGLGKTLLAQLAVSPLRQSRVINRHVSPNGTIKLLVEFNDGATVETVLMPWYHTGRAAGCVSSQVGCAMGCDFCASTKSGLKRSLTAGEIVEQYLWLRDEAGKQQRRLTSLVYMGMGEPMHNLEAVIGSIRRLGEQTTAGLGRRHITVSTVGIVPGIEQLAASDLGVHIAVSLHAPDDETRGRLVPMNRRYKVADILAAARRYQDITGQIVTIEYCMLADVNDSDAQAHELARLLQGWRAHVNLIPYNWIGSGLTGVVYQRPTQERMERFLGILREARTVAHFRKTRGDDVAAACGQLVALGG